MTDLMQISGVSKENDTSKDNSEIIRKVKDLPDTVSIESKGENIFDYIKQKTTSPTIDKIKKGIKESEKLNRIEKDEPKTETKTEVEILPKTEKENKVENDNEKLTDDELKYVSELLVELLDWGNGKIASGINLEVSDTTSKQKERLIFAWTRFLITLRIRFSPVLTLIVMIVITYGVKYLHAKKIEPTNEQTKTKAKVIREKQFKEAEKEKVSEKVKQKDNQKKENEIKTEDKKGLEITINKGILDE